MPTKENNNPSLLSKVAKFVRNPTTNWTDLDKQDPEPDAGYSKQALKEMIERKRQNDFVRKREFDQLRKLRSRDPGANPDLAGRPSYFQSSLPSNQSERAMTIKKIDEIEAQMSNQWWQGKSDAAKPGAKPAAPEAAPAPVAVDKAAAAPGPARPDDDPSYAATRLSPMKSEQQPPDSETSDFPPTQDNSDFGRNALASGPPRKARRTAELPLSDDEAQAQAGNSLGFSSSRPFAVELTDGMTDPDLEESAIRFANGDDAGAESGLLNALGDEKANQQQAHGWALALFDLYRATGQQDAFDVAAIEYARRFARSAPAWFSMPDVLGIRSAEASIRTLPSRLDEDPLWRSPERFQDAAVDGLRLAVANAPAPWFLDWSALVSIDADAIDPLASLFEEWCNTPVDLRFSGTRALEDALRACAPSGNRAVPQANWKLRLDALRVMQLQDEFELVALDYCVTYEVSPPSWQEARCKYQRDLAGSAREAQRGEDISAQAGNGDEPGSAPDFRQASTVPMGLESVQTAVGELSGEIVGEATDALDRLERSRGDSPRLVVSCANLVRVDFSAAGSILNWVATHQGEGHQVQFRDVHRLVAAFFGVIGIHEHASVVMRSN